ncbi:hypothetical protein [Enterococcus sp. LJL51]|uniref:hypothetical protein n=1 Tax=Enterococcus sp. LJL51 TaxID=3416656 RepID=UPI003CE7BC67
MVIIKKKFLLLFILVIACFTGFVSFANQKEPEAIKQNNFSKKMVAELKNKAKTYSEEDFQEGNVPLNEFICINGQIIKSDSKEETIKKGDRFMLLSGDSRYQVINEQEELLRIGDNVTVYGEYYGFLKGTFIEQGE